MYDLTVTHTTLRDVREIPGLFPDVSIIVDNFYPWRVVFNHINKKDTNNTIFKLFKASANLKNVLKNSIKSVANFLLLKHFAKLGVDYGDDLNDEKADLIIEHLCSTSNVNLSSYIDVKLLQNFALVKNNNCHSVLDIWAEEKSLPFVDDKDTLSMACARGVSLIDAKYHLNKAMEMKLFEELTREELLVLLMRVFELPQTQLMESKCHYVDFGNDPNQHCTMSLVFTEDDMTLMYDYVATLTSDENSMFYELPWPLPVSLPFFGYDGKLEMFHAKFGSQLLFGLNCTEERIRDLFSTKPNSVFDVNAVQNYHQPKWDQTYRHIFACFVREQETNGTIDICDEMDDRFTSAIIQNRQVAEVLHGKSTYKESEFFM